MKVSPGVSDQAPSNVAKYLAPLIAFAAKIVTDSGGVVGQTPIYLGALVCKLVSFLGLTAPAAGATAGMRVLPASQRDAYDHVARFGTTCVAKRVLVLGIDCCSSVSVAS